MSPTKPTRAPRRKWWQVLCRAATTLAVLLAGAVATAPWWLPTGPLAAALADSLSDQLGVPVRIYALHLSWAEGIEIDGLTIASPEGFGSRPLATVQAIRTELSPWSLLLHRHLEELELVAPRLDVRVDANGRTNLAPLAQVQPDLTVGRLSVREAQVTLLPPGGGRPIVLDVASFQLRSGASQEVSMSAALRQPPEAGEAPVSLSPISPRGRPGEPGAAAESGAAASAVLTFSNVELAHLPVASALGLPIRALSGRCRGAAALRINREGVVDSFRFDVRVRRLDVQPAADVKLPLIDEAALHVEAAYDHLTHALRVDAASLRLPGMDLAGKARLSTELLTGHWEALESLEISGQVQPARLAVLLTGQPRLPGDLGVDGPVEVRASAAREGAKLHVSLAAEATAAAIARGQLTLKPRGRICRAGLAGDLDHRTSGLAVEDSYLMLAGNRFQGHGALVSLRRLAARLAEAKGQPPGELLLGELARLEWRGDWEIRDPAALLEMAAPVSAGADGAGWKDLRLRGALTGRWFLHHGPATRVHLGFQASADTELAFAEQFVKPPGAPLHLDIDAAIDPNRIALSDLTLELAVGDGRLTIDRAELAVSALAAAGPRLAPDEPVEPNRPPSRVDFTGRLAAEQLPALLACVPRAGGPPRWLTGSLRGQFAARLAPSERRVRISADLRDAGLNLQPWLVKPAGQAAELHIDLRDPADAPKGSAGPNPGGDRDKVGGSLLACTWQSPQADVTVNLTAPLPPGGRTQPLLAPDQGRWVLAADVKDAAGLATRCPALARGLGAARLGGAVRLRADGNWQGQSVSLHGACDATALDYASASGRRAKPAGTALTLRFAGRAERKGDLLLAELGRASVELGGARADLAGRLEVLPDFGNFSRAERFGRPQRPWPPRGLRSFQLDANLALPVDAAMRRLVPELDRTARACGLEGRCSLRAACAWDGNSFHLTSRLDATELAAADLTGLGGPANPATASAPGASAADPNVPRKPAGMPASADLELTVPADLSSLRVHNVHIRLGELHFVVGGAVELPCDANGLPAELGRVSGHLALSTDKLESLAAILPGAKRFAPAGRVLIDADIADAARAAFERATIRLGNVRTALNGKELSLDGEVRLEKLELPARASQRSAASQGGRGLELADLPGPRDPNFARFVEDHLPAVARVATEGLEFRLGRTHGWLLADVAGLPRKPAGSFQVLAERIDQEELLRWLEERPAAGRAPPSGSAPASPPASRPWYRLPLGLDAQLRRDAEEMVRLGRKFLLPARLDGRMSVGLFRAYDPSVRAAYDLHGMELDFSAADGAVKVSYVGGLNGGSIRESYATNLADPAPAVTCQSTLHNVVAEENMQPQFARFFPGNTVHGTFDRTEKTSALLVEVLAGAMDARYPVLRVGTGRIVALDGVTEGRAAPEFVAKIFPGLNLARYHYRRMSAFTEFREDGSAHNDMIFDGKAYDLYMEGDTDPQHIGRYEIGLILLGTPQSAEWNHTYRLGRVPLLNFQARIEGGKRHDEQVSYLWPNETLFVIFLKNNFFYRIWLATGKSRDR